MTMLDPTQHPPHEPTSGRLRAGSTSVPSDGDNSESGTPATDVGEATQPLHLPFGHPLAGLASSPEPPGQRSAHGLSATPSSEPQAPAAPARSEHRSPTPPASPSLGTTTGDPTGNTQGAPSIFAPPSPAGHIPIPQPAAPPAQGIAPAASVLAPSGPTSPHVPLVPPQVPAGQPPTTVRSGDPAPNQISVGQSAGAATPVAATPAPTVPVRTNAPTATLQTDAAHGPSGGTTTTTAPPVAAPTPAAAPTPTPTAPSPAPTAAPESKTAVPLAQPPTETTPEPSNEPDSGFGDGLVEVAWDGEPDEAVDPADLAEEDAIEMLGLVDEHPVKPSKKVTFAALFAALAIVAGLAFAVINVPDPTRDAPLSRPVPDVLGKPVVEAETTLGDAFKVSVVRTYHQRGAKDTVVSQDPPPGGRTHRDGGVILTVSSGPAPLRSPDGLDGADPFELRLRLARADIPVKWGKQASSTVPIGFVAAVSPEEGKPVDDELTVFISTGPKEIKIPALTGMSWPRAEALLKRSGLKPSKVLVPSSEDEGGLVLETGPESGAVRRVGSGIIVLVGKGYAENEQLGKGARLPNIYYVGGLRTLTTPTTQPDPLQTPATQIEQPVEQIPTDTAPRDTSPRVTQATTPTPQSTEPRLTTPPEPTTTLTPLPPITNPPTTPPNTVPADTLPGVVGQTESAARATLEGLDYRVNIQRVRTVDPTLDGIVGSQIPSAGTAAQPGSAVWITVYSFDL